jgi:hypothetical protein
MNKWAPAAAPIIVRRERFRLPTDRDWGQNGGSARVGREQDKSQNVTPSLGSHATGSMLPIMRRPPMTRSPWPDRAERPLLAPRPGLTCLGPRNVGRYRNPRWAGLDGDLGRPEAVTAARPIHCPGRVRARW